MRLVKGVTGSCCSKRLYSVYRNHLCVCVFCFFYNITYILVALRLSHCGSELDVNGREGNGGLKSLN